MKTKIIISFLLFMSFSAMAQDIIVLKNGDEIKAIVKDIEIDNVKYKKHENDDGPTYTLSKSDIFMIKYRNGDKDIFSAYNEENVKTNQKEENVSSSLQVKDGYIYKDNVRLSNTEITKLFENNEEALEKYNSGRVARTCGRTIACLSGACLGLGISNWLMGDGSYATPAIVAGSVGAGLSCILYYAGGASNIKKSVEIYKSSFPDKKEGYNLEFKMNNSGFAVAFIF